VKAVVERIVVMKHRVEPANTIGGVKRRATDVAGLPSVGLLSTAGG